MQKRLRLGQYGGRVVRIGFYHTAARNGPSSGSGAGWHLDDVEIVPNFSVLLGSTVTRTGQVGCVSLAVAAVGPVTNFSFMLGMPAGHVPSISADFGSRFVSALIVPGAGTNGNAQWAFNLTTSAADPLFGAEVIGSICFTPSSAQSAFVPMSVGDTSVPLYPEWTVSGLGSRSVFIANEPLLEAWKSAAGDRTVTLYGKANTVYEIRQTTNLTTPRPWPLAGPQTVAVTLFTNVVVRGVLSNAPILFLDANEQ